MKRFVIASLVAAGFLANQTQAAPAPLQQTDGEGKKSLFEKLKLNHVFTLARHTSHASHRSHSSHRSSSGGYSYKPPKVYSPPPAYPRTQIAPPAPLATLPGNSAKFTTIVRQVQLALNAYGYYDGAIDGVIGPKAREALEKFQKHYKLEVTGTVTPEVLDSLGIVAE